MTLRAIVAVALALIAVPLMASGVAVQPTHLYLTAKPGTALDAEVTVAPASAATAIRITLEPFVIDANGSPRTCRDAGRSIAGWARAIPDAHIRIDQPIGIGVSLTVPADAEGSYSGVLMIDAGTENVDGVAVRTKVAVPIVVTVVGTEQPAASFSKLSATANGDGIVISGTVTNRGNCVLSTGALFAALHHGGAAVGMETSGEATIILPGGSRNFRFEIPLSGAPAGDVEVYITSKAHGAVAQAVVRLAAAELHVERLE